MASDWQEVDRRLLAKTRVFEVFASDRRSPRTSQIHEFGLIECPDWVNVVPLTHANEIVFIEQFRHGISATTLEVPGGMVDPGETPAEAAARELLEETGYSCEQLIFLGAVHPNPALQPNRCHSFAALGCKRVAAPHFDSTEECHVRLELASGAADLVRSGAISHALVIAALTWTWLGGHLSMDRGPG